MRIGCVHSIRTHALNGQNWSDVDSDYADDADLTGKVFRKLLKLSFTWSSESLLLHFHGEPMIFIAPFVRVSSKWPEQKSPTCWRRKVQPSNDNAQCAHTDTQLAPGSRRFFVSCLRRSVCLCVCACRYCSMNESFVWRRRRPLNSDQATRAIFVRATLQRHVYTKLHHMLVRTGVVWWHDICMQYAVATHEYCRNFSAHISDWLLRKWFCYYRWIISIE